jgi:hypothetical protein
MSLLTINASVSGMHLVDLHILLQVEEAVWVQVVGIHLQEQ